MSVPHPDGPEQELRHTMEEHRAELRDAVDELKEATRRWTDPRDAVRAHPGPWLMGALVVGLWLGWKR